MEERFYFCNTCGNLLIAAIASGVIPYCCGEAMILLDPNTTDGAIEKHLPVVTFTSAHTMKVNVGSASHPMTPQHNIRFVCLVTDLGGIIHYLQDTDEPEVSFCYEGHPLKVYAYCNLHGLWCADLGIPDEVA